MGDEEKRLGIFVAIGKMVREGVERNISLDVTVCNTMDEAREHFMSRYNHKNKRYRMRIYKRRAWELSEFKIEQVPGKQLLEDAHKRDGMPAFHCSMILSEKWNIHVPLNTIIVALCRGRLIGEQLAGVNLWWVDPVDFENRYMLLFKPRMGKAKKRQHHY